LVCAESCLWKLLVEDNSGRAVVSSWARVRLSFRR